MDLEFQEYHARKIVNIHKHIDGPWFWGKYTAHPYIGCRSGCTFCYTRGSRYIGKRDPTTFSTLIQVKINAVELLEKTLPNLKRDIITCGDWQRPAEDRYHLSRGMLEVVRAEGFPLFIVERSPLLTRDLDLLIEINRQSWVGVLLSISSLDPKLKQTFEPYSPGVKLRLKAMETLANAGLYVGTAMMPIFPIIGDDEAHLDALIRATREHGGQCVLSGALTMSGVQARRTLEAAQQIDSKLASQWRSLYQWEAEGHPQYSPPRAYNAQLGLRVRELCARYGLQDRMPRYIIPGPLAANKRIAEQLFLKTYNLELEEASPYRIWAYRKAAWTVDECSEDILALYKAQGEAGVQSLPGIGRQIAKEISAWIQNESRPHKNLLAHKVWPIDTSQG